MIYDLNSNLSAVTTWSPTTGLATGKTCLVHDALNRLTAVGPALALESPGNVACKTEADLASVSVRFKYDARNRRVARQDGTGPWKQWALLPDGSPLTEFWKPATSTGDWEKLREYVWLEGRPLAQVEYPGPTAAEGYVYSVHTDHIGLPRALTNSTGAVVWSATPTRPYGDVAETTTTDPANGRIVVTNLRLPGQYDEKLLTALGIQGPYYNWNRWYLPMAGRYMEMDPIGVRGGFNGPFGPNWYGYAEANPLTRIDPDAFDSIQYFRQARKVIWYDDFGIPVGWYSAMSGPFGNGALPDGLYMGNNLRLNRNTAGMVCGRGTSNEVGYSVDLDPTFPTSRDLLRFHPREGNGTLGCIGIDCGDASFFLCALIDYFITRGRVNIPVLVLR